MDGVGRRDGGCCCDAWMYVSKQRRIVVSVCQWNQMDQRAGCKREQKVIAALISCNLLLLLYTFSTSQSVQGAIKWIPIDVILKKKTILLKSWIDHSEQILYLLTPLSFQIDITTPNSKWNLSKNAIWRRFRLMLFSVFRVLSFLFSFSEKKRMKILLGRSRAL